MKKNTLVLGASLKEIRYSIMAIKRLRGNDFSVVALGLRKGKVADVNIITEKKLFKNIDTITLYLNPKRQIEYYQYILDLKPRRVIFNPGTENMELLELLEKSKIQYEIACTLVLLSTKQY